LSCTEPRARPVRVDLVSGDRGEEAELLSRTRHRDVEPALSAVAVERAEVHQPLAGLVRAVGDAEEDLVALVALDVLEVLHEHLLERRVIVGEGGARSRGSWRERR